MQMSQAQYKAASSFFRAINSKARIADVMIGFTVASDALRTSDLDLCKLREMWDELTRVNLPTQRQERIKHLSGRFSGPVFYICSGRDCDGVVYGHSVKFDNLMAANEGIEKEYYWADGPVYFEPCTREEYEAYESHSRDTFAEAAGY